MTFDFESWARLARDDPQEFERRRQAEIEAVIAQARPEAQQRLRGLQFRIDLERSRSDSPLGACIRVNRMMWESFTELRGSLERLKDELAGAPVAAPALPARAPAQVLPFRAAR